MRCLPSSILFLFLFCNEPIWLARHPKKTETWEAPKSSRSYVTMEYLRFGQRIWDTMRCCWEHPWSTHWELREHHGGLSTIALQIHVTYILTSRLYIVRLENEVVISENVFGMVHGWSYEGFQKNPPCIITSFDYLSLELKTYQVFNL